MLELNGNSVKKEFLDQLASKITDLKLKGIIPKLAVVIVDGDDASSVYVKNMVSICKKIDLELIEKRFPNNVTQQELESNLDQLNSDDLIHGIIVQVPLPKHLNQKDFLQKIRPQKDLDCITVENIGNLTEGRPRFIPCTPYACLKIIEHYKIDTAGKEVVIVGRSNTVGRPLSILLSQKPYDATVTVCHSKTLNLKEVCKRADILIGAIGSPKYITKDFVKAGAVVLDVGINWVENINHPKGGEVVGDVDYENIKDIASAITPVPGGVGPLTVTMLISNCLKGAEKKMS